MVKEVWNWEAEAADAKPVHENSMVFPMGKTNDEFAWYFIRQCYIVPVSADQVEIFNVTYEPGSRNNWHIKQLCIQPDFPKRAKQAPAFNW